MSNKRDQQDFQQDFLWFTYFGITKTEAAKDETREAAMRRCIERAYLDLSRTLNYTKSTTWLDGKEGKAWELREKYICLKRQFKQNVIQNLSAQIKELLVSAGADFDEWHEKACDGICELAGTSDCGVDLFENGRESFTYGQAQKWVNMTLKNMLIMGLWEMEEVKKNMHIPLDSYIFKAAAVNNGESIHDGDEVKGLGVLNSLGKWSKITNYKEYRAYQKRIRDAVEKTDYKFPIDWEGPAWIAQAKEENKSA